MGVVGISGRGAQLRVPQKRVTKCRRQHQVGVQASTWRLGQGCKCDILWDHVTLVDRSVVNLRRALHLVAWLETRPEARMRAQTVVQERLRDIESHCAS
ncbi:hypothetical protein H9Q69_006407 [Fusarium xylarioides]|uniref:Uncharacterized protein n=1 Tax=Fusarium xylarioides TaxID=221167 RepID=A0A9P7IK32_9HYPO|nr:hypothetical protein H9Q72_000321 [Fusarium xylarioides]KAG5794535.1 hypothetical protein H9Q69_006407 [Fusarium xylarioides]KAG5808866.1 hypothetical protein H9Q71_006668 [Fusarium xylarioides]